MEQQLSDLEKLAKPTEEQNPNFVNFLINNVNNTELSHDNFKFNRESNVLGEEPSAPKQEPTQQDIDSQIPNNIGGQQQAPVQSQQQQQGNVDWNNLAQQQSQPDSNPFNDFDVNSIDDVQVPFDTQSQNTQQAPESQPEPQQATQEPPKQKKTQSIDDVLGSLDLDNL